MQSILWKTVFYCIWICWFISIFMSAQNDKGLLKSAKPYHFKLCSQIRFNWRPKKGAFLGVLHPRGPTKILGLTILKQLVWNIKYLRYTELIVEDSFWANSLNIPCILTKLYHEIIHWNMNIFITMWFSYLQIFF